MMNKIEAPFTDEQVDLLNAYQRSGRFHPYTCGQCRQVLIATPTGWKCPSVACDYKQNWAWEPLPTSALGSLFQRGAK